MPEKKESAGAGPAREQLNRREQLKKELNLGEGEELAMPPIEHEAQYLIGYLFEIGPTQAGGMGAAPLSHAELQAWQHNTGIELQAWEARLLKRLSTEYLIESQQATRPDQPPPWADAPYIKTAPNLVAQRMQAGIKGLAKL